MIVFFNILPLEGGFGLVEMNTSTFECVNNNLFVTYCIIIIIIYCLNFEQSIGVIYTGASILQVTA